jgi:hypothetical protein
VQLRQQAVCVGEAYPAQPPAVPGAATHCPVVTSHEVPLAQLEQPPPALQLALRGTHTCTSLQDLPQ